MPTTYQILRMETAGTPPVTQGGVPMVFNDPAVAAARAKEIAKLMGEKLCVKPVIDDQWRKREQNRFVIGAYRSLPWVGDAWWNSNQAHVVWKDQFPHASLEKPGWIAFTKSEEDGAKDKQTLLRPGAYLNRYFTKVLDDYGKSERFLVETFMKMYGPIDIKFATTEKEVERLYDLLTTCLHGKRWPQGIHPATLYIAGDLQVAYIGDLDKGKVSARAVVWPEKKLHSRIYGDVARMTQGLQRLGYTWGAPIGAKIKRIQLYPTNFDGGEAPMGCFAAPYIDKQNKQGGGHLSVKDKGDHLIICAEGEPGSHHAGQPDGTTGLYVPKDDEYPTFTCQRCEEEYRRVYPVFNQAPDNDDEEPAPIMWCEYCKADYSQPCHYSGNNYTDDVKMVLVSGLPWLKYYADMYAVRCEGNGKLYNKTETRVVHFPDGDKKTLSFEYTRDNGGLFQSYLTQRYYFKSERAAYFGDRGESFFCAKSELTIHTFQCDGCDEHHLLGRRNQVYGDDRLFCNVCRVKIQDYGHKPISKSRKIFEENRKQGALPLVAAE